MMDNVARIRSNVPMAMEADVDTPCTVLVKLFCRVNNHVDHVFLHCKGRKPDVKQN